MAADLSNAVTATCKNYVAPPKSNDTTPAGPKKVLPPNLPKDETEKNVPKEDPPKTEIYDPVIKVGF